MKGEGLIAGLGCLGVLVYFVIWLGWIVFLYALVTDFFDLGIAITHKI